MLKLGVIFGFTALFLSCSLTTAQTIDSFTLIDATTDLPMTGYDPIVDGTTIDLAMTGTSLNIRVDTTPSTDFGSVVMALTGATTQNQTESVPPWALAGDSSGNFNAMTFNVGAHTMTANAFTGNGGSGTQTDSLTINFTVIDGPGSTSPVVSITSPANGASFLDPANFTLAASASDPDGTVTQVEFFVGGTTSLGVDAIAPFEQPVSGLTSGSYTYTAVATDNDSNTTTSDPVTVNVITPGAGGTVGGELKRWHRVSVTFDGPSANESDTSPNPSLDYRLDVTFTGPSGKAFVVPGFFAADGDAGVSGATAGNKWRAYFAPDETGTWSYLASFRTGTNVAVGDTVGTPTSFDGTAGIFVVEESDKTGDDFRAPERGLLINRGHHYLTFANAKPWVKGGPDIPENLLAYDGFDNTATNKHKYTNHLSDWNPGDPDWDSPNLPGTTDGRRIIGAMNFIAEQGGNCIYFLPMNIGGDGNDTFPTLAPQNKTQYDVSKLDQWEIVFSHAQSLGIYLHFQLAETENANENYHDNGTLGTERKLFYRELIARFGYHLALEWDIGEENDYGHDKHVEFAAFLKLIDPYDHPVTTHMNTNQFDTYFAPKLGNDDFDKTTFQATLGGLRLGDVESEIEEWRRRSREANVKWMVSVDEPQKIENDKTDPVNGYPHGRTSFLWPIYLEGGGGFEWYVQQDGGGHSFDQEIDDFNLMDVALQWTGYAHDFLDTLPLLFMEPRKDLASSTAGGTTYCLAQVGGTYALYNEDGGTFSLDLSRHAGSFQVEWFDPRNGGPFITGNVVSGGSVQSLGAPPNNTTSDWAVRVSRLMSAGDVLVIRGADRSGGFLEAGNDESRTEHLCDIFNTSTSGGNHGWDELRLVLEGAGYSVTQITESVENASGQSEGIHIDLETIDLSQWDAIIMGSNNAVYDTAAVDALEAYVRGGGGVVFISDANWGSDWSDASTSDQQFLDRFGIIHHQDQGTYSLFRTQGDFLVPSHPIFAGVDRFDGEGVTPARFGTLPSDVFGQLLSVAKNNTRLNEAPFGNNMQGPSRAVNSGDASLLVAEAGAGRVAVHFDRNTFFNLNGAGTNINRFDNTQYATNLIDWLAAAAPLDCGTFLAALPNGEDGLLDNPDDDIWLNIFEHLFGLDAESPDGEGAVTAAIEGGMMTLSFETLASVLDVEFVAEVSETMEPGSWTSEDVSMTVMSRSADGKLSWKAVAGGVHAGKPRLFMRLAVQKALP
ncbi:MAG: DUF5060 domain-containing protein [Verrucomicrobiota bacterium]